MNCRRHRRRHLVLARQSDKLHFPWHGNNFCCHGKGLGAAGDAAAGGIFVAAPATLTGLNDNDLFDGLAPTTTLENARTWQEQ